MKLVFLPGFLGPDTQEEVFLQELRERSVDVVSVDLFSLKPDLQMGSNFLEFAENFDNFLSLYDFQSTVLCGYSMGGRLLLDFLSRQESAWRAVILSANPGYFGSIEERQARAQVTRLWLKKWSDSSMQEFLTEWNAQTVFSGSTEREVSLRRRAALDPEKIERALRCFCPTEQEYRPKEIDRAGVTGLWLTGERDVKYLKITNEIKKDLSTFEFKPVKGAGHRVHIDQPREVFDLLWDFLQAGIKA